ncbi:hypothetical protein C3D70_13035 [Cronobacter sakazakii]|uniref:hypothetical protein n=1 Tax=Cronobacter sakazakii TaxID=28141 RepID=UPI000CF15B0C|nr:hypothetical protein [Cronobacter sakazakii]PPX83816.1 hypothetical protein C3D70_13035 [Cronobacter sakazakii]
MNKIKFCCALILAATWCGYYLNFGIGAGFSEKTEVWGQFGDYVGGVVNPILSFVTIYLLINSIGLQRDSNDNLTREIKRQEQLEEYKKFELRFFRLIESQEESFSRFKICVSQKQDDDDGAEDDTQILSGGAAVTFIENCLVTLKEAKIDSERVFKWLDELDEDGSYFSILRRFYLILKLIDANTLAKSERDEMYETLVNLTDIKVISMIAILSMHYDWYVVRYIRATKILDKEGVREFINMYKTTEVS